LLFLGDSVIDAPTRDMLVDRRGFPIEGRETGTVVFGVTAKRQI